MAKDTCIMCGAETPYDFETHIDMRIGYIEGAGQLCGKCHDRGSDRRQLVIPMHLVKHTPNNTELGAEVRKLYWELND